MTESTSKSLPAADAAASSAAGAAVLRLLAELDARQWWEPERLARAQLSQATRLVDHAIAAAPFHAARLAAAGIVAGRALDWETWRRIPVLTRREVQQAGADLHARDLPHGHGRIGEVRTSGSTGMPVVARITTRSALFFRAVMLQSLLWFGRDFAGALASIRKYKGDANAYPAGGRARRWGSPNAFPFPTGPSFHLGIGASVAEQTEWLTRRDPHYLLSYPSNLRALAEHCRDRGVALPRLRQLSSLGEVLDAGTRAACRAAWDVAVMDVYSAEEVGHIAVQCPAHEHYHVPAPTVLVEVLDEEGNPCAPGQVGRVVVTPLHNFATPLIRYELGDYAEAGAPCACGRGLPVLARILGRVRNMLVLPNGARYWPSFGSRSLRALAPVVQHQFVQVATDRIEARLVCERPLTGAEEAGIRALVLARLPCPFALDLVYRDAIPRSAGGKYEDFTSLVAAAPSPAGGP